jgi:hypothetical protein
VPLSVRCVTGRAGFAASPLHRSLALAARSASPVFPVWRCLRPGPTYTLRKPLPYPVQDALVEAGQLRRLGSTPASVPEGLILRWLTERVGPLSWHEVQKAEGIPHTGRSQTSPAPIPNAAAIAVMSEANKLALRARLQAGHVPHPDGTAVEVAGGSPSIPTVGHRFLP